MKLMTGTIIENSRVTDEVFKIRLRMAQPFEFSPGQFINIKVSEWDAPLLRRPISISRRMDARTIELLVKEQGAGTRQMRFFKTGTPVDFIGPLGRGFNISGFKKEAPLLILGGGIGTAPLKGLSRDLANRGYTRVYVVNGFKDHPYGKEDFECYEYVEIDESKENRFVTDHVSASLNETDFQGVFACGPTPMLKRVREIFKDRGISVQLSLEEKMACGVGACLGCAVKIKTGPFDHAYKKVCVDGPVFEASEVIFE